MAVLVGLSKFSHGQDMSKYLGGSYDGFAIGNISQTGLGGLTVDASKYKGGSYDGFSVFSLGSIGLGGLNVDVSKFKGGSYDGFAVNYLSLTGLGGLTVDASKYKGGSYDGFAFNGIGPTGLGGLVNDAAKYKGGSFDGFSVSYINLTGLGGIITDGTKYKGGSYDGFTVSGTQLIPLNGGNMKLRLTAMIEGFYNPVTDKQIADTVMVYLRISNNGSFTLSDSAKVVLDSLGGVTIDFHNAPTGNYYIVIKHRNSIETWSSNGQSLASGGVLNVYNFTLSQSNAYGNNMVLKGSRYCIFSGDINQDGVVDGADLALIDNDVTNFTTGYASTDVNGDQVIDGSDLSVTDNNVSNFVSVQKPPGAPGVIVIQNTKKTKNKK